MTPEASMRLVQLEVAVGTNGARVDAHEKRISTTETSLQALSATVVDMRVATGRLAVYVSCGTFIAALIAQAIMKKAGLT